MADHDGHSGELSEKSAPFELTSEEQQEFNVLMSSLRINGKTVSQAICQFRNALMRVNSSRKRKRA